MAKVLKVQLSIDIESEHGEVMGEVLATIITELITFLPVEAQAEVANRMLQAIEHGIQPPDESQN